MLIELLPSVGEKQCMTQRDLAAALKRPHSFVGRFEAGERRLNVVEFVAFAEALTVDPIELFTKFVRS